jgi:acyl phosphate:glycerol-3-phosphate acyltransferase
MPLSVLLAVLGYLIGSIPSGFLVTRWRTGLDLRQHGSKNIGTLNSFEVTGKKHIGAIVLVSDLLKGAIPMIVAYYMNLGEAVFSLPPAIVLGHCYPIWLRFHGGRGLATAAGIGLIGSPVLVVIWILIYFAAKSLHASIHFRAFLASVVCIMSAIMLPENIISTGSLLLANDAPHFDLLRKAIAIMMLVVLTRHVQPLMALYRGRSGISA